MLDYLRDGSALVNLTCNHTEIELAELLLLLILRSQLHLLGSPFWVRFLRVTVFLFVFFLLVLLFGFVLSFLFLFWVFCFCF